MAGMYFNPDEGLYLPNGSKISDGYQSFGPAKMLSGPPPGTDPMRYGGRIPARWTYPYTSFGQPLIELPQNKFLRISLAVNAWLGEPIINSASKQTISMAFENMLLTTISKATEIPDWIPEDQVTFYKAQFGNDPSKIVAAYVKQQCLDLSEYLNLKTFFQYAALDVNVCGDAFINIASNATPEEEMAVWNAPDGPATMAAVKELQAKMMQDGRGLYRIEQLQALNPSAVWLYPDYTGNIVAAKVVHTMGDNTWDIPTTNLIHLKAFTFPWVTYGISQYIAALRWVEIKYRLMDAMWANATRFVNPKEWLEIAGPEDGETGAKLPPTDEQMGWAQELISAYSMGQPHALPGGWKWNMLGAEGKALPIQEQLEAVDDAIRTSAQVSRTFTSGSANVPAYATSKLQAGVMYKSLNILKEMSARAAMVRIFRRFCEMRGFFEQDGTVIAPNVEFRSFPIQGDDSTEKKITALGQLGMISAITVWELEGIDAGVEFERMQAARQENAEPWRATPPSFDPKYAPTDMGPQNVQNQSQIQAARVQGLEQLNRTINGFYGAIKRGDDPKLVNSYMYQLGHYAAEAQWLKMREFQMYRDNLENPDESSIQEAIKEETEILQENNGMGTTMMNAGTVLVEAR